MERILQFVHNQKDLMNCRLVCYRWLCIIDAYVGLRLKLNRSNKVKVFVSPLIRSCTALKIYKSAGMLNWPFCSLSPWNLKSVDILMNILCDNWRLLLTQCQGIQFLTITAHLVSCSKTKTYSNSVQKNSFEFKAEIPEKIDHCSLRRLYFKNIHNDTIENERDEYTSVANMLNTIGNTPQLRQIVITTIYNYNSFGPNGAILKTSILSLMQRNPRINSFGHVLYCTLFHEIKLWDKFLEEDSSYLAHGSGAYAGWAEVLDRMLNIGTLHYKILLEENFAGFATLIANVMRASRNLKTLILIVGGFLDFPTWVFNCDNIQQCLRNLKEFTLRISHQDHNMNPLVPTLENFNVLSNYNVLLEYLDISLELTEENLTTIFDIPKLAELHIRFQKSAVAFKEHHFEKILNHPKLKLVFWHTEFQRKWNQFNEGNLHHNWENWEMKPQKVIQCKNEIGSGMIAKTVYDGYFPLKSWKKISQTFVLYNNERITDSDRVKIRDNYQ